MKQPLSGSLASWVFSAAHKPSQLNRPLRGFRQLEAILDSSSPTAQYSTADFLAHEGVRAFIDAKHAIAHNKIMIIDGEVVLTGPSTSRRRRRRGTPRICSCCTTRTCSLTRAELAGSSGAFRSVRRALSGRVGK